VSILDTIEDVRQQYGITNIKMAEMLKISPTALYKIKRGDSLPSLKTAKLFYKNFNVNLLDIL
jgi:DNA-binding XRE family transcriptional regulator